MRMRAKVAVLALAVLALGSGAVADTIAAAVDTASQCVWDGVGCGLSLDFLGLLPQLPALAGQLPKTDSALKLVTAAFRKVVCEGITDRPSCVRAATTYNCRWQDVAGECGLADLLDWQSLEGVVYCPYSNMATAVRCASHTNNCARTCNADPSCKAYYGNSLKPNLALDLLDLIRGVPGANAVDNVISSLTDAARDAVTAADGAASDAGDTNASDAVADAKDALAEAVDKYRDTVVDAASQAHDAIADAADGKHDTVANATSTAHDTIANAINSTGIADTKLFKAVHDALAAIAQYVHDNAAAIHDAAAGAVQDADSSLQNNATAAIEDAANAVKDAVSGVAKDVGDGTGTAGSVAGTAGGVAGTAGSVAGSVAGAVTGAVGVVQDECVCVARWTTDTDYLSHLAKSIFQDVRRGNDLLWALYSNELFGYCRDVQPIRDAIYRCPIQTNTVSCKAVTGCRWFPEVDSCAMASDFVESLVFNDTDMWVQELHTARDACGKFATQQECGTAPRVPINWKQVTNLATAVADYLPVGWANAVVETSRDTLNGGGSSSGSNGYTPNSYGGGGAGAAGAVRSSLLQLLTSTAAAVLLAAALAPLLQ